MRHRLTLAGTVLLATPALAGPPYATDDPEPTETGHWEIYNFATSSGTTRRFEGAAGLDLNYGPVADVQVTATVPLHVEHDGGIHAGPGNLEMAVKYRFFHRDDARLSVAIFPRVVLPTAGSRFGSGQTAFFLPVWAQKEFGKWAVFGGGGYAIDSGLGNRDTWQGGLALTRDISDRVSLGGEIASRGRDSNDGRSYVSVNAGGVVRLGGPFAVLWSGGPGILHHHRGGALNGSAALGILL